MSLNDDEKDYIIATLIQENRALKAQIAAIMEEADRPKQIVAAPKVHGAGVYAAPGRTINLQEESES